MKKCNCGTPHIIPAQYLMIIAILFSQVIRHYHGHLSAVYSIALHPNIDVLVTAGRDSTGRVWDMRTKANVHTLVGHTNTVASVICQTAEPQVFFI